ncbi:hypothetical protein BBJ28_00008282 [Nothophytophthora sp. Chile5]|nr:hypothetical protein BBJ28_00008282 [Nothophytophthora sp. Chile5]
MLGLMPLTSLVLDGTLVAASGEKCAVVSRLKVMSFNLRTSIANDPCPSGCWEQRKERAKQLVERYQPDLIGTQEGAPDQIAFLETQLSFASLGECAGECQWNERNSIFYKPDRWEVLESSTFALPQSAVLVAYRLSQHCKPEDTVILTGDLNAVPDSAAVKYLADQGPLNGAYTPIPLYETLTAANAGGPTWIGSSFGGTPAGPKYDYIFARHDVQTCLRNGSVLADTFDGYSSSDHAVLLTEFCLFNALTSFASGLADPTVAYRGNVVVYLSFASCSLLAALPVNTRPALAVGSVGYALYAAALFNLQATWVSAFLSPMAFYYVACAAVGISAGFLWTAQGRMIMSYATHENQGRYLSTFWIIFNLGAACGGALGFVLNFHNVGSSIGSLEPLNRSTSAMYVVFLGFMSLGVLLAAFGIVDSSQVVRENGTRVDDSRVSSGSEVGSIRWHELPRVVASNAQWRVLLWLLPLFAYSNWFYTYHSFFNVAVFNARTSGLASSCYWLAQMAAAFVVGRLLDRQVERRMQEQAASNGSKPKDSASVVTEIALWSLGGFALLANVMWAIGWYFQACRLHLQYEHPLGLDVATDLHTFLPPFLLYLFYGWNDALCQVWIYWYMGALAERDSSACGCFAGVYKGVQAASAALAWQIGAVKTDPLTQLVVNWALCNVAMLMAVISWGSRFPGGLLEEVKGGGVALPLSARGRTTGVLHRPPVPIVKGMSVATSSSRATPRPASQPRDQLVLRVENFALAGKLLTIEIFEVQNPASDKPLSASASSARTAIVPSVAPLSSRAVQTAGFRVAAVDEAENGYSLFVSRQRAEYLYLAEYPTEAAVSEAVTLEAMANGVLAHLTIIGNRHRDIGKLACREPEPHVEKKTRTIPAKDSPQKQRNPHLPSKHQDQRAARIQTTSLRAVGVVAQASRRPQPSVADESSDEDEDEKSEQTPRSRKARKSSEAGILHRMAVADSVTMWKANLETNHEDTTDENALDAFDQKADEGYQGQHEAPEVVVPSGAKRALPERKTKHRDLEERRQKGRQQRIFAAQAAHDAGFSPSVDSLQTQESANMAEDSGQDGSSSSCTSSRHSSLLPDSGERLFRPRATSAPRSSAVVGNAYLLKNLQETEASEPEQFLRKRAVDSTRRSVLSGDTWHDNIPGMGIEITDQRPEQREGAANRRETLLESARRVVLVTRLGGSLLHRSSNREQRKPVSLDQPAQLGSSSSAPLLQTLRSEQLGEEKGLGAMPTLLVASESTPVLPAPAVATIALTDSEAEVRSSPRPRAHSVGAEALGRPLAETNDAPFATERGADKSSEEPSPPIPGREGGSLSVAEAAVAAVESDVEARGGSRQRSSSVGAQSSLVLPSMPNAVKLPILEFLAPLDVGEVVPPNLAPEKESAVEQETTASPPDPEVVEYPASQDNAAEIDERGNQPQAGDEGDLHEEREDTDSTEKTSTQDADLDVSASVTPAENEAGVKRQDQPSVTEKLPLSRVTTPRQTCWEEPAPVVLDEGNNASLGLERDEAMDSTPVVVSAQTTVESEEENGDAMRRSTVEKGAAGMVREAVAEDAGDTLPDSIAAELVAKLPDLGQEELSDELRVSSKDEKFDGVLALVEVENPDSAPDGAVEKDSCEGQQESVLDGEVDKLWELSDLRRAGGASDTEEGDVSDAEQLETTEASEQTQAAEEETRGVSALAEPDHLRDGDGDADAANWHSDDSSDTMGECLGDIESVEASAGPAESDFDASSRPTEVEVLRIDSDRRENSRSPPDAELEVANEEGAAASIEDGECTSNADVGEGVEVEAGNVQTAAVEGRISSDHYVDLSAENAQLVDGEGDDASETVQPLEMDASVEVQALLGKEGSDGDAVDTELCEERAKHDGEEEGEEKAQSGRLTTKRKSLNDGAIDPLEDKIEDEIARVEQNRPVVSTPIAIAPRSDTPRATPSAVAIVVPPAHLQLSSEEPPPNKQIATSTTRKKSSRPEEKTSRSSVSRRKSTSPQLAEAKAGERAAPMLKRGHSTRSMKENALSRAADRTKSTDDEGGTLPELLPASPAKSVKRIARGASQSPVSSKKGSPQASAGLQTSSDYHTKWGKWLASRNIIDKISCLQLEELVLADPLKAENLVKLGLRYARWPGTSLAGLVLLEHASIRHQNAPTTHEFWFWVGSAHLDIFMRHRKFLPIARFHLSRSLRAFARALASMENMADPLLLLRYAIGLFWWKSDGNLEKTHDIFHELLSRFVSFCDKDRPSLLFLQFQIFHRLKLYMDAIECLTKLLALHAVLPPIAGGNGASAGQASPEDAPRSSAYDEADYRLMLLQCQQSSGDSAPASQTLSCILRLKGKHQDSPLRDDQLFELWFSIADKCFLREDYSLAMEYYAIALNFAKQSHVLAAIHYNLGLCYQSLGEDAKCVLEFKRARTANRQVAPLLPLAELSVSYDERYALLLQKPIVQVIEEVRVNLYGRAVKQLQQLFRRNRQAARAQDPVSSSRTKGVKMPHVLSTANSNKRRESKGLSNRRLSTSVRIEGIVECAENIEREHQAGALESNKGSGDGGDITLEVANHRRESFLTRKQVVMEEMVELLTSPQYQGQSTTQSPGLRAQSKVAAVTRSGVLAPEKDRLDMRRKRSMEAFRQLGYVPSTMPWVEFWEKLLALASELFESRRALYQRIAHIRALLPFVTDEVAFCALAESVGNADEAAEKLHDPSYERELSYVCAVVEVAMQLERKFPLELTQLPHRGSLVRLPTISSPAADALPIYEPRGSAEVTPSRHAVLPSYPPLRAELASHPKPQHLQKSPASQTRHHLRMNQMLNLHFHDHVQQQEAALALAEASGAVVSPQQRTDSLVVLQGFRQTNAALLTSQLAFGSGKATH